MIYLNDSLGDYGRGRLDELLAELPGWRLKSVERLGRYEDRVLNTIAFRLLADALLEEYGMKMVPEFSFNAYGKPYFAEFPDIHFNLSHCEMAAGCVIGPKPCGIDVESIRKYDDEMARYISSPKEYDAITHAQDPALAFTILWTRKESLCKLRGTGLPTRDEIRQLLMDETLPASVGFQTFVNREKSYVLTTAMTL